MNYRVLATFALVLSPLLVVLVLSLGQSGTFMVQIKGADKDGILTCWVADSGLQTLTLDIKNLSAAEQTIEEIEVDLGCRIKAESVALPVTLLPDGTESIETAIRYDHDFLLPPFEESVRVPARLAFLARASDGKLRSISAQNFHFEMRRPVFFDRGVVRFESDAVDRVSATSHRILRLFSQRHVASKVVATLRMPVGAPDGLVSIEVEADPDDSWQQSGVTSTLVHLRLENDLCVASNISDEMRGELVATCGKGLGQKTTVSVPVGAFPFS